MNKTIQPGNREPGRKMRIVSLALVLGAPVIHAQRPTDVAISELPSGIPSTEGKVDLATEAGRGLISEDDAKKAASDALAVSTGSLEFVRDVATGAKQMVNTVDHIRDLQGYAIRSLGSGRFPADKVLPLLDEIEKKFPDRKVDVNFARRRLNAK